MSENNDFTDLSEKVNKLIQLFEKYHAEQVEYNELFRRYFMGEFDRDLGFQRSELASTFTDDFCVNCPNNPANGGSGICHCTLGNRAQF